ncbi:hypothetical protein PoMZ_03380 [Pyricularia oryzae]|uniref:Uncharacterized protein n=1 Tax=Pyricularia oryzae TaxID=318829 RepID=A0A4P7N739_PYROR|nr:hypothetical protein PoMZ_03380 [Pyricularia oryzae]
MKHGLVPGRDGSRHEVIPKAAFGRSILKWLLQDIIVQWIMPRCTPREPEDDVHLMSAKAGK